MPLVPPYIQNLSNYVPGQSIEQLEREGIKNIYKLASNENSLGPSPMAIEAIKKSLKNILLHDIASLTEPVQTISRTSLEADLIKSDTVKVERKGIFGVENLRSFTTFQYLTAQ